MPFQTDSSNLANLDVIASIEAFRALSAEDIRKLARIGRFIEVPRDHVLVRQGDPADVLYYVLNGRFAVEVEGREGLVNEIRRGEPIGEIAFFRGGVRTANVRARRASLVLAFDQDQMDELARSAPRFSRAILTSLADRLAKATPRIAARSAPPPARTIAIAHAGRGQPETEFAALFAAALGSHGRVMLVRGEDGAAKFQTMSGVDPHEVTSWVEAVEDAGDFAVFDTMAMEPALALHILATVDSVLLVAAASSDAGCNEPEAGLYGRGGDADTRLVLVHDSAAAIHPGTKRWLDGRKLVMHHHLARGVAADVERLARFVTGHARGFVAAGGGAACAAQVGVYKAFRECGMNFDIFGGTSAGAAMAAAFAHDLDPHDIDARIEDIFVARKAMGRFTIPRYSLLDHRPFDDALRAHFGDTCIEDLHRPYFALSTNLSTGEEYVHRDGPVWQAVRASGAIPGLLPPFYTARGEMLVDGCLLDNVPLRVMHRFSAGPNVVVAFRLSQNTFYDVAYDQLPGRWQIAASLPGLFGSAGLPKAPGIVEVLMRSITLSHDTEWTGGARDLFIVPPLVEGIGIMDWDCHSVLMEEACRHTLSLIGGLEAAGNPVLRALGAGIAVPDRP